MTRRIKGRRPRGPVALLLSAALVVAACGEAQTVDDGDDADPGTEDEEQVDAPEDDEDAAGEEASQEEVEVLEAPEGGLSLWSRSGNVGNFTEYLAEQWNEENPDSQIAVTIIPAEQYMTRVATAGAAGELPDLLGVDLIYMPDLNAAGPLTPITDRIAGLPYADDLAPAHVAIGEWEGEQYSVPLSIDVSTLVYRPDLFERAGLDPDSPPTSLDEIAEYAAAVNDLGDDVYGFYFPGASAGANAFTLLPTVWASGGDILTDDEPPAANFGSAEVETTLTWLRDLWEAGAIPASAQGDDGAAWVSTFYAEDIGIQFCGSFCPSIFEDEAPELDYRFALIPGATGGQSSFGGGDVIGLSRDVSDEELAWSFIEWLLSDEVQEEHYHGNRTPIARTDLEFEMDEDQEVFAAAVSVTQTPRTLGYNELFNNPNSPWLEMIQTAVFDGDVQGAIQDAQARAQEVIDLAQ